MKRQIFILIALVLGFCGCQTNKKEATITGTIVGDIQGDLEYASSENGACSWQFAKPLSIDSSGHFCLTLKLDDPAFFQLVIGSYPQNSIIIEPGLNYEIQFNTEAKNDQRTLNCKNSNAQYLYSRLPSDHPQNASTYYTIHKKPIPSNVFDSINIIKESEILKFKKLLDSNEISEPFFELVKADRTCYYAAIQNNFASALYSAARQAGNKKLMTEIVEKWRGIFQNSPLNAPYMVNSFWFYQLGSDLINFKKYWDRPVFIDSLAQNYNSPTSLSFDVNLAQILFDGKSEEYFLARYLQEANNNITKNEELVTLIQEFKNNYPQSSYQPYMDAIQKSMTEYLKIADAPFNNNIKFLDSENINSLKECVSLFKGKKIYIDVWASWCLPCRAEFKHLSNLKTLLSTNDTELLFISIDNGNFKKMWPNLIKFYNLEGFHVLANEHLNQDLREIYNNGGSVTIPWNLLIDENGQIVKLHASRPSQLDQLNNELKIN